MFQAIAKLFFSKQVKFADGKFELMGIRDSFTPLQTYAGMLKSMVDMGFQNLIYYSAKSSGFIWFEKMAKIFPRLRQSDAIKWGVDLVTLSGWGVTKLEKIDFNKKFSIFTIKNSPVAKYYGRSKEPIDHLFRGLVAGGMSFIWKEDVDSIETTCNALEGDICKFIVAKRNVMPVDKKILSRQLNRVD